MSITPEQLRVLTSDLNPARVKQRSQAGQQLSYLEAYDVKATLIRVFGFGGFSAEVKGIEVLDKQEVAKRQGDGTNWKVSVMSTVRLEIHSPMAVYTEAAVGSATLPDIGQALDMAAKTASSDALKRAAIYLGTQFGLGLYDNGSHRDVVRKVFAPGQEWPVEQPLSEEQQKVLADSLGATPINDGNGVAP